MDNDIAIRVSKICKTYKNITALKDIDLNIRKGELFGLIGPDGAGKTSLFRILTTLSLPDSGEASVVWEGCRPQLRGDQKQHRLYARTFRAIPGLERGGESEFLCHDFRYDSGGEL